MITCFIVWVNLFLEWSHNHWFMQCLRLSLSLSQLTILQQLFGGHCGLPTNIAILFSLYHYSMYVFLTRGLLLGAAYIHSSVSEQGHESREGVGVGRCRSGGGSMNERSSYVTRSRVESLRRASRHRSWSSAVSSSGVRSCQLFSRIFIYSLLCFFNQLFGCVYSLF